MANKERLSEFNRSNILSAANQLFREKGIGQTTVDDIAQKAEYSKSTIYVYFKSKDDIYNHIVLEHFQRHKEVVAKALQKSPGFPDGYFAVCHALAKFYEENPLYFESILDETNLPEAESESVLHQIYKVGEENNRIIGDYIKSCIEKHQLSLDMPSLQGTFTLWASISGIINLANKKESYIRREMGISKEKFMNDGFVLLLKSLTGGH